MSLLAPTLQAFFSQRLIVQKNASPHTIASYRDCWRLLLCFAQDRTGTPPARLSLEQLDAPMIGAFLDYLEHERGLSITSRNTRLAAVHSLFRFAALRHPEHAALIGRVLAIPAKRGERALVCFLTPGEVDALLASPDRSRWIGRRDHALLLLAVQTGLRVSELTSLRIRDLALGNGAHVRCTGKAERTGPPRLPARPPTCCASTSQNGTVRPKTRCSRGRPDHRSAPTPSGGSSNGTQPAAHGTVPRSASST